MGVREVGRGEEEGEEKEEHDHHYHHDHPLLLLLSSVHTAKALPAHSFT